jgi:hypothetical protein
MEKLPEKKSCLTLSPGMLHLITSMIMYMLDFNFLNLIIMYRMELASHYKLYQNSTNFVWLVNAIEERKSSVVK